MLCPRAGSSFCPGTPPKKRIPGNKTLAKGTPNPQSATQGARRHVRVSPSPGQLQAGRREGSAAPSDPRFGERQNAKLRLAGDAVSRTSGVMWAEAGSLGDAAQF